MVTYSDYGYSLGKVLATAHLRLPFTSVGTGLSIDIDGKPTRAVVAPMPFFDPGRDKIEGLAGIVLVSLWRP
ncbi:glycine cleavage T C-terminal barrel domain-containing protein [Mesorhizobium sp. WSM3626]|uniref:glycine cleavage T C-terminal barrel domain-containing protein n=1 Tax=Mesorhizobium sp. WSM3626 TaxID=1040987 RepID=UPI0032AF666A